MLKKAIILRYYMLKYLSVPYNFNTKIRKNNLIFSTIMLTMQQKTSLLFDKQSINNSHYKIQKNCRSCSSKLPYPTDSFILINITQFLRPKLCKDRKPIEAVPAYRSPDSTALPTNSVGLSILPDNSHLRLSTILAYNKQP